MQSNLLIVDDERFVLSWLTSLFASHPEFRVFAMHSAKEALSLIRENEIQIMLSDISMPELDGLALLRELRHYWPKSQVVFLTGYNYFDFVYEAMQYEGVRYLLKNESDGKIVEAVKRAAAVFWEGAASVPAVPQEDDRDIEIEAFRSQAPIVMQITQYIDTHLADDLSLRLLADRFHFNQSYLSRMYKTVTGNKLSEYIFARRIERSRRYLAESGLKIGEVARRVGYSSAKSFSRLFKQAQGLTPQEYRDEALRKRVKDGYRK